MSNQINLLVLGDIIGSPGCQAVFLKLKSLIKEHNADFVIANGENAYNGYGLTSEIANNLFASGVDLITSGNHIWQNSDIFPMLNGDYPILRPANYPKGVQGRGSCVITKGGVAFGIINLIGRVNLVSVDCPFAVGKREITQLTKSCDFILVDFHAESVEEKEAFAYYVDGTVSSVWGTHTHVQSADERILPKGTSYISDIGCCGPVDSTIGSDPNLAIRKAFTQLPIRAVVADSDAAISGIVITLDKATKKATAIKRIYIKP